MFKRISIFFTVAVFAVSCLVVPCFALVEQSEDYYVADYAGILSESTEKNIIDLNMELEELCSGAQIVVVSVDSLEGMGSDEYAVRLFDKWQVGSANENNGMLLLMAPERRKVWLTVGAGIDSSMTDDKVNALMEKSFYDDYDAGNFDEAVMALLTNLSDWYGSHYGVTLSLSGSYGGYGGYDAGYGVGDAVGDGVIVAGGFLMGYFMPRLIFLIIVVVIIALMIRSDRRRYRAYYTYLGMPAPRYHWWYMWGGPHRVWYRNYRGPRGPRGPGPGGPGGPGPGPGPGGYGGAPRRSPTSSGFRSAGSSRPSGGFSRPSGGFSGGSFRGGGFSGGSFRGGGGFSGGGGGGRR